MECIYMYLYIIVESAKRRAERAHVPTCSACPTCPRALCALRAQVYFTDQKIKKWEIFTRAFLRVLRLILDLNFRSYRFIQTG